MTLETSEMDSFSIEQIKTNQLRLYICGSFTYKDGNQGAHGSTFCLKYDPKLKVFSVMPFYNDA
jgi:hypothetical protein